MRLNVALMVLVGLLFLASLFTGSGHVPAWDTLWAYLGHGDPLVVMVMHELRLPRAVMGLLAGASLGMAGAAMQGLMRNP